MQDLSEYLKYLPKIKKEEEIDDLRKILSKISELPTISSTSQFLYKDRAGLKNWSVKINRNNYDGRFNDFTYNDWNGFSLISEFDAMYKAIKYYLEWFQKFPLEKHYKQIKY